MVNLSKKLKRIKKKRKARGFTNITSTRLSRKQKKDLDDKFKSIVDKLSLSTKNKLSKTMSKIQAITRGNITRKKFPEKKRKLLQYQEKKLKESIGPKFFKTLQEIPPSLLEKLINKIFDQYELQDDEAKNILIISIISSNVVNNFNKSIDNLYELKKTIIKYCKELVDNLSQIISYGMYPSSADEEEREMIDDEFRDVISNQRDKMRMISIDFNKLLIFREKILKQLNNILKIVDLKDNDSKLIQDFIKNLDVDWYKELEEAESSNSTYRLSLKLEDMKKQLSQIIENVKMSFERLIKIKLIFSKDKTSRLFDVMSPIYDATTSIDYTFHEFETFMESKKKSKSRSKSRR